MFQIPELPTGSEFQLKLLTSWDDPVFVGLSGIEIFCENGAKAPIKSISSNAVEFKGDLAELISLSVFLNKRKKLRGWIGNYKMIDEGRPVQISICFDNGPQQIAMIRIWVDISSNLSEFKKSTHQKINYKIILNLINVN